VYVGDSGNNAFDGAFVREAALAIVRQIDG